MSFAKGKSGSIVRCFFVYLGLLNVRASRNLCHCHGIVLETPFAGEFVLDIYIHKW